MTRKTRVVPALALACAAAAVSFGARAGNPMEGLHEARKPPAVMSKVSGVAGPATRQPVAAKVAADAQVTVDAQATSDARAPGGSERGAASGPARVKPGVGPGNGQGVQSKGPAPR